jgi:hypothetical protein
MHDNQTRILLQKAKLHKCALLSIAIGVSYCLPANQSDHSESPSQLQTNCKKPKLLQGKQPKPVPVPSSARDSNLPFNKSTIQGCAPEPGRNIAISSARLNQLILIDHHTIPKRERESINHQLHHEKRARLVLRARRW